MLVVLNVGSTVQCKSSCANNVNKLLYLADVLHIGEHNRTTRSSTRNMLSLPFCKLKAASPAFCIAAPTVWNNLYEHVMSSASINIFRERPKTKLFACYS